MKLNFEWVPTPGRYSYGSDCRLGGYVLGHTFQPTQSKGYAGPRWQPTVFVPGMRIRIDLLYEKEEDAKACIENALKIWISRVIA